MMHALRAGALALLLLPSALAAQPPGGELPGRLETSLAPRPHVRGLTAEQAREWNETTARIAAVLAEHPEVRTPPAGTCLRLSTVVEPEVVGPRAIGEFGFSIAARYDARGCSATTTSGVLARLNDAMSMLHPDGSLAVGELADEHGPIVIFPYLGRTRQGHPIYLVNGRRSVVLTRGGTSLLVPVSRERWLRWRLRDAERALADVQALGAAAAAPARDEVQRLRALLAALSPAARQEPACRPDVLHEEFGACHDFNRYVSLDPRYFSAALPKSALQVLVVSTPHTRHAMEAQQHAALRWRVFESLDYDALAALLR